MIPISSPSETTPNKAEPPRAAGDWPSRLLRACHGLLMRDAVVFGVPGALLVFGLIGQLHAMIIPDIAWYLHSGARYLEGGTLYRDIFIEVNPPLGFFLTLPAAIVAHLTGLFAPEVFVVYVYLLIAASLGAVWRLLRDETWLTPVLGRGLFVLTAAALVIGPGNQLGQREHFMILLSLPYLLLTARRAGGFEAPGLMAFGFGLAAGLGFALKPYYLLIPLALEAYLLWHTRRPGQILRPEALGLGLAMLGYGAVLALVTPDYLTRIVPYALEVYNQAYRNPIWAVVFRGETVMLPVGCFLHLALRRGLKAPHLGDVLFIAAACWYLTFLIQMKGWTYHLYPASTCLVLGYAVLFLNGIAASSKAPAGPATGPAPARPDISVACLVLAGILLINDAARLGYSSPFTRVMAPYVERYAQGGAIAIFGSNVWPGFPLVNYKELGWSSRFPTLWLLPGTVRKQHAGTADNPALLAEMERFTRDAVIADLAAEMPDLIVVDDRTKKSYFAEVPFDYLEFFGRDPRFAPIWSEYVWVAEEHAFDIYRRRCAPNCRQAAAR